MKIVVTGGTGFVGARLVSHLKARKDEVRVMTRSLATATGALGQDVDAVPLDADPAVALGGRDAVVNLAGEPILGRRWTRRQKEALRSSRIDGVRRLVQGIRMLDPQARPKTLVSASAVGYFGPRGDQALNEDAPGGADFLAQVCREWEEEARRAEDAGVRVVVLRIGVVLGPAGGALERMLPPFRMGLGGPIGLGRHVMSWIHLDDLTALIAYALDNPALRGPVNATAPNPVTNKEFARTLGRVLGRPAVIPTPPLALRVALGGVAQVLTTGQRVLPKRAVDAGFTFRFPDLEGALRDALRRPL